MGLTIKKVLILFFKIHNYKMKIQKLSELPSSQYPSDKIFSFILKLKFIKFFENLMAFNSA